MTSLRNRRDRYSTSKVLAEELRAENWEETHGKNKNSHTSKNNSASYADPPRGGGWGLLPIMAYTGRFCPKRVPCSGFRYVKGYEFHYLKYKKGLGNLSTCV